MVGKLGDLVKNCRQLVMSDGKSNSLESRPTQSTERYTPVSPRSTDATAGIRTFFPTATLHFPHNGGYNRRFHGIQVAQGFRFLKDPSVFILRGNARVVES
jgi:hypothetical protein